MAQTLNDIITGFYNKVLTMNQMATENAGIEVLYFIASPDENSKDVIFQEYSLSHVCEGKQIKVILGNSDYKPGNVKVDLFGIDYESMLELHIDYITWVKLFGNNTMPQQKDILYVPIYHLLFEVVSSTVQTSVGANLVTAYTIQCKKYNPSTSRIEEEHVAESIKGLTVSQEELFGKQIEDEVTDITDPMETFGERTSYRDWTKTFDMSSVIDKQVLIKGHVVSNAYYSFYDTMTSVKYNDDIVWDSLSKPYFAFTYMMRWTMDEPSLKSDQDGLIRKYPVDKLRKHSDEDNFVLFSCKLDTQKLNVGDVVTLYRGSLFKFRVEIAYQNENDKHYYVFKIHRREYLKANKILPNFWERDGWNVEIEEDAFISFSLFNSDNLSISVEKSRMKFMINGIKLDYDISEMNVNFKDWNSYNILVSKDNIKLIIFGFEKDNKIKNTYKEVFSTTFNVGFDEIKINNLTLEPVGNSIDLCNLRIYATDKELKSKELKALSLMEYVDKSHEMIASDGPGVAQRLDYIGRLR